MNASPGPTLLVSGDRHIALLDWTSGAEQVVELPPAYAFDDAARLGSTQPIRAFGLTWHPSHGVLVACHEQIGVLAPDLSHIGFFAISPLWFMTHAIAVRDDVLYTCNARIDVLGVHDLETSEERFVHVGRGELIANPQHLKPLPGGYEFDRHHPNAIVAGDDDIAVLVHDFDETTLTTSVVRFDRRKLTIVARTELDARPLGSHYAHDLAVVDDGYLWCDTYRRRVRHSDGRSSGALGDETEFLRGLAVDTSGVYVGVAPTRGVPGQAAIVRLDRDSLRELDRRPIPMPVEICTVRIASGADDAHPAAGTAPVTLDG